MSRENAHESRNPFGRIVAISDLCLRGPAIWKVGGERRPGSVLGSRPLGNGVMACAVLTPNSDKIARNLGASDVESFQRRFVTLVRVHSRGVSGRHAPACAETAARPTGHWKLTTVSNSLPFKNLHVTHWGSRFCRKFSGKPLKTKNTGRGRGGTSVTSCRSSVAGSFVPSGSGRTGWYALSERLAPPASQARHN